MEKKQLTSLQKKRKAFLKEYIILTIIQYVLLLSPIVALVIWKRDSYFTMKNGLQVSIGCILALVVTILLIKGQNKLFSGIWKFVVVFALCFLLRTVMDDCVYISGAVLIGNFLAMWFKEPIANRKKLLQKIQEAQINKATMEDTTINVVVTP